MATDKVEDEVLKSAQSILESIAEATKSGAEFAKEQLPDIAQQYITWGIVDAAVGVIIYGVLTSIFAWGSYKIFFNDDYDEFLRFIIALIGSCATAICLVSFFTNLSNLILVTVAPKVWLIKNIVTLLH